MADLAFREVNIDDVDLIYEWANDKETRNASFNSEPIIYEQHVSWFKNKLKDEKVIFKILMDNDIPVGSVRLELIDNTDSLSDFSKTSISLAYQINYQIAPSMRGKGYGKKLISMLPGLLDKGSMLVAQVKENNISSIKCFRDNGYKEFKDAEELRFTLNVI